MGYVEVGYGEERIHGSLIIAHWCQAGPVLRKRRLEKPRVHLLMLFSQLAVRWTQSEGDGQGCSQRTFDILRFPIPR